MRRKISYLLICLLGLSLVACATWKSTATVGYEVTGATLIEIKATAQGMCEKGTISQKDCDQIKNTYNKAREAYITAGDALILAMQTEDTVLKQKSMEAYQKAINDASQFAIELVNLAIKLGIKVK